MNPMKRRYKSLIQFIKEELYSENVLDLLVKYAVEPKKIILKAPASYNEDAIIQYLQDLWFNELPGGAENIDEIFGVNSENLIDTFLEYRGFRHDKHEIKGDKLIEWHPKENPDNDEELEYFCINDVKYCMSFEKFELKVDDNDNIDKVLEKIFKSYESNAMNKYPIEIKLLTHDIEYKEDNL